jgi:hypothetical protein
VSQRVVLLFEDIPHISWPRPVTETRLLSWGYLPRRVLKASIRARLSGLARCPLGRWPSRTAASDSPRAQPWGARFRCLAGNLRNQHILSQAWTPLQSFTVVRSKSASRPDLLCRSKAHRVVCTTCAFRGFEPSNVSPPRGAPLCSRWATKTHQLIPVAPSGFLTLSTRCSPRDLPSLFHPGSVFGVYPSRFFAM